jgi:hypothetical protein
MVKDFDALLSDTNDIVGRTEGLPMHRIASRHITREENACGTDRRIRRQKP